MAVADGQVVQRVANLLCNYVSVAPESAMATTLEHPHDIFGRLPEGGGSCRHVATRMRSTGASALLQLCCRLVGASRHTGDHGGFDGSPTDVGSGARAARMVRDSARSRTLHRRRIRRSGPGMGSPDRPRRPGLAATITMMAAVPVTTGPRCQSRPLSWCSTTRHRTRAASGVHRPTRVTARARSPADRSRQ